MNNRITIKMPVPIKVWAFYYNKIKSVGFSFDNQAMFQFRENVGFDESADGDTLAEWTKTNGNNVFQAEYFYGAHQSYCIDNVIKPLSKESFILGLGNCREGELIPVVKLADKCLKYGAKQMPGKKKAEAKP